MNSGVTAALLAYGLWGLMPLYFRLMAPATAIEVVAHRIVWSLALLLLWLGVLGQLGPLWRRLDARLLARLALAALLVSINWLTYVWAVTHGRTLDASLGYFLLPLFNVALGVLLLGERLTRGEWIGVMLAALGVGYLALVSPRLPWVALVLAASFGVYGLVKKQTELPAAEGMALETGLIALPALAVLGWLATRGQLAIEVRQKLQAQRPATLGQAGRISGVTPAAISLLLVHLKKGGFKGFNGAASPRAAEAA